MTQVFESDPKSLKKRAARWKYVTPLALAGCAAASVSCLAIGVYPVLLIPMLYTMMQSRRLNLLFRSEVQKMWLMQNGD